MRITVCQLRNDPDALEGSWAELCRHVHQEQSELVLLPEMPFSRWLAERRVRRPESWVAAVNDHEAWIRRLGELEAPWVAATRPVVEGNGAYNEGFVWERASGSVRPVHRKRYLPDEPGFWEATWYDPGEAVFEPTQAGSAALAFAICTEIWFHGPMREYSRQGLQLLVCPRATLEPSVDKWIAGGRAAAVVSGAFCLSSNFSGPQGPVGDWGGAGWIIEPEEGDVLGVTTEDDPFLTLDVDLSVADAAKGTYPRYVKE